MLLSILEPLVINEENAKRATENGVIQLIGLVLVRSSPFFTGVGYSNLSQSKQMIKLAVRSLVSVIRLKEACALFMKDIILFDALAEILEQSPEEEIVANSLKVIRIIFKDTKYMLYVSSQSPATVNRVIYILLMHGANSVIVKEVFAIVTQYCSLSQQEMDDSRYELHRDITDESVRILEKSGQLAQL